MRRARDTRPVASSSGGRRCLAHHRVLYSRTGDDTHATGAPPPPPPPPPGGAPPRGPRAHAPTPTSCGVSLPEVDPVTSPTTLLEQVISGSARTTGARYLTISSEAGSFRFDCYTTPPACGLGFAVPIPLAPGLNHLNVCDVNGNSCGGESIACTTEDRNGAPLVIDVQTTPSPTATPTSTATETNTSTFTPTSNRPTPKAEATVAPNPAYGGQTVSLDGRLSSGAINTYQWTHTCGGPKVAISDKDSALASFVAPAVDRETTLTFTLTLTSFGATSGDRTTIDVRIHPAPGVTPAPRPARFAYVADSELCNLSVIDLTRNTVSTNIRVGDGPKTVAITPDRRLAYVTTAADTVVIDTASGNIVAHIATASPSGVAVSPDGRFAYVTSTASSSVNVIDTSTSTIASTISLQPVAADPLQIVITPDGALAYVTTPGFPEAQSVSVIDTAAKMLAGLILLPRFSFPEAIALSKDGQLAAIANSSGDSVSLISTVSNTITATIPVGHTPLGVVFTPDGRYIYVTSRDLDSVTAFDIATETQAGLVQVASPVAIAVSADGRYAYATSEVANTVSVIDTHTNDILAAITVGDAPRSIALAPACPGDCNNDAQVGIEDLVTMVALAPSDAPLDTCFIGDPNGDRSITFAETLRAVDNALHDCVETAAAP